MTTQENVAVQEETQKVFAETQEKQLALVRHSLINSTYQYYHQLIQFIKTLPISQTTPGLNHAFLQLDGAMLWIKEILSFGPIVLATPPKAEESENVTLLNSAEKGSIPETSAT